MVDGQRDGRRQSREDTVKGRYPRGRLAALVCLPLVAAVAAPPAAPEKAPAGPSCVQWRRPARTTR
jgi:hypothetical protein